VSPAQRLERPGSQSQPFGEIGSVVHFLERSQDEIGHYRNPLLSSAYGVF
jgi:hypothetical protein